jgi:hypothetical protein
MPAFWAEIQALARTRAPTGMINARVSCRSWRKNLAGIPFDTRSPRSKRPRPDRARTPEREGRGHRPKSRGRPLGPVQKSYAFDHAEVKQFIGGRTFQRPWPRLSAIGRRWAGAQKRRASAPLTEGLSPAAELMLLLSRCAVQPSFTSRYRAAWTGPRLKAVHRPEHRPASGPTLPDTEGGASLSCGM